MLHKHILKTALFLLTFLCPLLATAQPKKAGGKVKTDNGQLLQASRYSVHTGIDILPGDETTSVRLRIMNEYQFNPNLSAGLGIGFTYYNDPLSLLPLFLDMKFRLSKGDDVIPFLFLKSGYNFSILTDTDTLVDSHKGGFLLNPGIGLQFEANDKLGWYLNAGYNLDRASFKREQFGGRMIETEISFKRLLLGAGLSF